VRAGIISDIHSNLPALEKVLEDIDARGADEIFCLGDIVGYGANPQECLALVREKCTKVVAGNHDLGVVGKADLSRFSTSARIAAEWTADVLDFDERKYLAELPLKIEDGDMCLVHASPREPARWEYLNFISMLPGQFASFNGKNCFVGHSHKPLIWNDFGEKIIPDNRATFQLEEGTRYFVNAGSIGQPRDGDPRTGYVLFDDVSSELTFVRLDYDIKKASDAVEKAGLPEKLASRLYRGF